MTENQWARLDYKARAIFVRETARYRTPEIYERIALLCDRAGIGDMPSDKEWSAASSAARWVKASEAAATEGASSARRAAARAATSAFFAMSPSSSSAEAWAEASDRMIAAFFVEWQKMIDE